MSNGGLTVNIADGNAQPNHKSANNLPKLLTTNNIHKTILILMNFPCEKAHPIVPK